MRRIFLVLGERLEESDYGCSKMKSCTGGSQSPERAGESEEQANEEHQQQQETEEEEGKIYKRRSLIPF